MTALEIAQLISIILAGVISIAGLFGVTVYFAERARQKAGKKNRKELEKEAKEKEEQDKLEALRHQQYENALRTIIREENKDLKEDVSEIKENLQDNTKGTITLLRNDMKKSLDYCKRQGYASSSDKANWHELYNTYGRLGGNHFKEFVDAWKQELDALPIKPDEEAEPKKRTRKSKDK